MSLRALSLAVAGLLVLLSPTGCSSSSSGASVEDDEESDEQRAARRDRRAREREERVAREARERTETEARPPETELVRGSRPVMSTVYQVSIATGDPSSLATERARAAIDAALDEVERLGVVLSEWTPESEVSRINSAAGGAPVVVSSDTLANVREALRIASLTDGAYDITWAALRDLYLFQPGEARVPDLARVRERLPLVGWRDVVVDERASTVALRRAGMAIGLGGIAKGWAVDRAGAIIEAAGFPDYMIFGGGQVLVHGRRGERAWRVGVQHPRRSDYIGFVEATDASIATSGDYEHFFVAPDGTRWHHIIDLSTGLPARESTSVTIIAPTGLLADGLDTGCFVMGPERCLALLASRPELAGVEAVIIDDELRVHFSPGARDRFVMRMPLDAEGRLAE